MIVGIFALLVGVVTLPAVEASAQGYGGLTRAEAIALLVESQPDLQPALESKRAAMPPVPLFRDVRQHHWYAPYIEVAFEQHLIRGNPDGTFRPGSILTSEEGAMLLARAWAKESAVLFIPRDGGAVAYVPSLAELASAYGMRTSVGPFPLPRDEFLSLLVLLYDGTAAAGLSQEAVTWVGVEPQLLEPPVAPVPVAAPQPRPVVPVTMSPTPRPRPSTTVVTSQPSPNVTAAPTPSVNGTSGFSISMSSLGIQNLTVTHPDNPFTHEGLLAPLKQGVGHLFSYPGRGGKILIYGHSSSYPWDVSAYTRIFRQINKLAVGDTVTVNYDGRQYTYRVREKKTVPARDLASYQDEGNGEELVLYTCWPPDSVSERYLVIAEPV
ncbi:MAG: S-layer domain-containing protein [Candidatus Peregrinibacteria bacterium Gr01-1014_25]|nr:MAG: S-layer domain-containing protein [Candidatus Peregrinibacteria bacterium Gr01-1014_25]